MPSINKTGLMPQLPRSSFEELSTYGRGFLVVLIPVSIQVCLLFVLFGVLNSSNAFAIKSALATAEVEDFRDLVAAETVVLATARQSMGKRGELAPLAQEKLLQADELAARISQYVDQGHQGAKPVQEIVRQTRALLYEIKHRELLRYMKGHQRPAAPSAEQGLSPSARPSSTAQSPQNTQLNQPGAISTASTAPGKINFSERSESIEALLIGLERQEELFSIGDNAKAESVRAGWFLAAEAGIVISLFAILILTAKTNRYLLRRIVTVDENTRRLAHGQKLLPALRGIDEIAQLDRALHSMAGVLSDSFWKEKLLFHSVKSGLASVDRDGYIQEVNNAVVKLLGYEAREITGKQIQDLVPAEERQHTAEQVKMIGRGTQKPFELPILRKDHSLAHALWTVKYDPEQQKIFCVVQDMTEAFEAEQLRKHVLQMVSHDLRNPLATIGVVYELLDSGHFIDFSALGRDRLAKAKTKLAAMLTLVNNLLDIEKIEAGMLVLEKEAVPSHVLIEEAIGEAREAIHSKNLSIYIIGPELTLFGDKHRLTQVMTNLLLNAVDRSPNSGKVRIMVADREDLEVLITVSDEGPLMTASAMSKSFSRYRQQDAAGDADSAERGRDLGRAICKALVELHGGRIGAKTEGQVTMFFFSIKAGRAS